MPQAQQVAVHQIGADVAFEQLEVWRLVEGAGVGQVLAVVEHDQGVLDAGVLHMDGRSVQPGDAGVDEQNGHFLADVDQIQRMGHDGDAGPFFHLAQGGRHVGVVMQDADGVRRLHAGCRAGADPVLFAILVQGGGQDAAVPTVGDKSFEDAVLHHALHGADRQAQPFGCLAGAEVVLRVLLCFHARVPWFGGFARVGSFGPFGC